METGLSNGKNEERVKLIRICNKDGAYTVDALKEYKLLGLKILSRRKTFVHEENSHNWYESGSRAPVAPREKEKLDHWLVKHKRFLL